MWAASSAKQFIVPSGPPGATMAPLDSGIAGGSQPQTNMLPYQTINFIISSVGIFPTQKLTSKEPRNAPYATL